MQRTPTKRLGEFPGMDGNSNVMTKNDNALLLTDIRDSSGKGYSMVSEKRYPLAENFNERAVPWQESEHSCRHVSNTEDDWETEIASFRAERKNLKAELAKLDEMCSEIRMFLSLF
uniref:Uncharacterized protein n=1 Tax=Parascaris univalens TaxID=6257 RepID=A0A915AZJ7_PARUN